MRTGIRFAKDRDWHRWFAWYPVKISDTEEAWLEYVERRYEYLDGFDGLYRWTEYRKAKSIIQCKWTDVKLLHAALEKKND